MEAIAGRAGVTKMTLCTQFGSKYGLLAAYLLELGRRWREHLEKAPARYNAPVERLLAVFDAYREWLGWGGFRGCSCTNFSAEFPGRDHLGRFVVLREHKEEVRRLLGGLAVKLGAVALGEDKESLGRARLLREALVAGETP